MRSSLLTLILFSLGISQAFAQLEVLSFKNVREGKSLYSTLSYRNAVKRTLRKISREELITAFDESLQKQKKSNLCAYDLNRDWQLSIGEKIDLKGAITVVRQENEIDDVVAGILLKAQEVNATTIPEKDDETFFFPEESELTDSQILILTTFEKKLKTTCFDEAYRGLYTEIQKTSKKFKSHDLEGLIYKAFRDKKISPEIYVSLEQARINKLEAPGLGLLGYHQKVSKLRLQYPLRDLTEKSDYISGKVKGTQLSRRQKLYEYYSDLQIIMMGNVIKKLRARLEYDSWSLSGSKEGSVQEVVELDPMERFNLTVKLLRKETALLSLNTYFNGRAPDFLDLIAASYEIGIIPASELETVAALEEIWSPKKTFWDKAQVWVRTFSSVATIVIPPPYGFIPALVLVIIEATAGKKEQNRSNDPTVII